MVEFSLAKCKTKAAYSAKLPQPKQLDLGAVKGSGKFKLVMETKILLVLERDGLEFICHGFGEILFKNCDNEKKMREIAQQVYAIALPVLS